MIPVQSSLKSRSISKERSLPDGVDAEIDIITHKVNDQSLRNQVQNKQTQSKILKLQDDIVKEMEYKTLRKQAQTGNNSPQEQ